MITMWSAFRMGCQFVSDDDGCPILRGSIGGFLNHTFGVRIEGTNRFVEEKHLRLRNETAGNKNALILPA
ncbi:hypothetical protein CTA1_5032 [Colletotrichum tanaceti]|uniref:Uncharacterized protein n=1 Tax=Colletotrichum tanaceti TaxID=1306861 RepID=A0A4U6XG83_9PEZI|nr:hypothetical protein CTA1_5032 [Colletotrichum tanaceti]